MCNTSHSSAPRLKENAQSMERRKPKLSKVECMPQEAFYKKILSTIKPKLYKLWTHLAWADSLHAGISPVAEAGGAKRRVFLAQYRIWYRLYIS